MRPNHFMGGGRGRGGRPPRPERTLAEISVTVWLTPDNASFALRGGLLYLTLDGTEKRVTLFRQFPFDLLWEYISVLDEDEHELGIVKNLALFDEATRSLLENELKKRYYSVTVTAIHSVKERFGFSYWRVNTNEGEKSFTLKDTSKSISTVNQERIFFTDADGNRYEIPDINALDAKSRRCLELYI
jgi:hypothetical protein